MVGVCGGGKYCQQCRIFGRSFLGFSGQFTGIVCVCSGGVMDLDRLEKTAVAFLILPLGGTAFDGLSCVT